MMDNKTIRDAVERFKLEHATYSARASVLHDRWLDYQIAERDGDEHKIADTKSVWLRASGEEYKALRRAKHAAVELCAAMSIDPAALKRALP